MVQPKYNPQEALERVKLMMNYDLSKTSVENKKVIEEQTQPVAQPAQTQPKADNKQDTPDPSKPQKLKPKDSPLGTTLKDTSIPKRSCVVYVNQLYEAFTRYREGFDPDQINNLRKYVQRCMDDHFPSGSRQGNWGITGLGGSETDQKLLKLSACPMKFVGPPNPDIVHAPHPSQSGTESIFRLTRKC